MKRKFVEKLVHEWLEEWNVDLLEEAEIALVDRFYDAVLEEDDDDNADDDYNGN